MPFDIAARPAAEMIQFAATDLRAAFAQTTELDPVWAAANPEKALAFLMVSPSPCAALDVLLAA